METVFKTSYLRVTEKDGVIMVGPRSRTIILMALIELVIGVLSYMASQLRFSGDGAIEQICFWTAVIILPCAGLMFILGLFQSIFSKVIFNCNSGKMRKGGKTYEFSQIENLRLESMSVADREINFLTADINRKPIKLISERSKDTLEEVTKFLNRKLAFHEVVTPGVKEDNTLKPSWAGRHFFGMVAIFVGAIWSGTGFFFLPNLIFTSLGDMHGPLVWPLGIWIAGLGLGDLMGLPVSRVIKGGSGRSKIAILIMVLYFGSYFLICWR